MEYRLLIAQLENHFEGITEINALQHYACATVAPIIPANKICRFSGMATITVKTQTLY